MSKIFIVCLIGVALFIAAVFIFKVPVNTALVYGAILLCPLMHLFMMSHRGRKEKNS